MPFEIHDLLPWWGKKKKKTKMKKAFLARVGWRQVEFRQDPRDYLEKAKSRFYISQPTVRI